MQEFLEKLTSYNLFNNLLPGVIFAVFICEMLHVELLGDNLAKDFFVSYFIGLIINRFGSLVVEPVLRRIGFVEYAPYEDFVKASQKDPKIEIILESNNIYRTMSALFILVFVVIVYDQISIKFPFLFDHKLSIISGLLLILFLLSYRKQTEFIKKRVASSK